MTRISQTIRHQVVERAGNRCEYCLFPNQLGAFPHEVDHIVAIKHKGDDSLGNLCLSCFNCNRHKGTDLTSIDPATGQVTLLFNPRKDGWQDHFQIRTAMIEGLTPEGRTTVAMLQFNDPEQIEQRAMLIEAGLYP
jgi:5-methylcytosine-specific restriction endonuclease McrA